MDELGVGCSTLRAFAHNEILEVRQGDGTDISSFQSSSELLKQRLWRAKVGEVQAVRRTLELEIVGLAARQHKKADPAMVLAGTVGAYAHWKLGNVVTKLLVGLIPGILIGNFISGSLALVLSEADPQSASLLFLSGPVFVT